MVECSPGEPHVFRHQMQKAAGLRFHFIRGGQGPCIVLLAGFPQSCYAWRKVMPLLAALHTVIAIDLPGQGDSDKPLDGYDTQTTAERVQALLRELGMDRYLLVGHDIGAWVAYPYAHLYPQNLSGVVFLDGNIPGVTLKQSIPIAEPDYWRSWHFFFNMLPDLPEVLLAGRERLLIEWFFRQKALSSRSAFDATDIEEYERVYKSPGGLRGMLGYYRAVIEDIRQNDVLKRRKLQIPVLALGGDQGSAPDLFAALTPLGEDVRGGVLKDCGHYLPEEQPQKLAETLLEFAVSLKF